MKESQSAEIKEFKDFTTITNIRKLTQEAITPVVKRYSPLLIAALRHK